MQKMTERYDEMRRPFDLEAPHEVEESPYPDPEQSRYREPVERAPWEEPEPFEPVAERPVRDSGPGEGVWGNREVPPADDAVRSYAAEDVVEDAEVEEEEEEEEVVAATVPEVEEVEEEPEAEPELEHAPAGLSIPDGYRTIEGEPHGERRSVAIVVSRFNGEITSELLSRALDELDESGTAKDAVTIIPVPGAFELPLAAMAVAKTRRYACVVALGCVIRGETPHFDYIASEAASGLQLAALETGTPVSFGVLTCETREQAEARLDRAVDAVRTALEMADVFSKLRAAAAA
jgi:6,7-dimethyl-8-ribityllumazine synthase